MSEKDLMIGDNVTFASEVHKVLTINSDGLIFLDGCDDLIPIGLLEPITITPEILKKNGFKQRYWNGTYYPTYDLYANENNEQISVASGRTSCYCYKKDTGDIRIHCKYIHELQHALRLCNIDKKIEL